MRLGLHYLVPNRGLASLTFIELNRLVLLVGSTNVGLYFGWPNDEDRDVTSVVRFSRVYILTYFFKDMNIFIKFICMKARI